MTADEVVYAGGLWNAESYSYYFRNSSNKSYDPTAISSVGKNNGWRTMSPFNFEYGTAIVFYVDGYNDPGKMSNMDVYQTKYVIRPVISLKSCVELTGGGTTDNPYEVKSISDNDACALADN